MRLEDLIGQHLGRYEIKQLLGRGGMAAVFSAFDTLLQRLVALKVLYAQYGGDQALIERFKREAVIAARLDHPNIVPIFDVGESNGLSFIAMKLVSGSSLETELLKQDLFAPDQALRYVQSIADALDFAHSQGVIHRDIKPGNVLLSSTGDIFLSDFGIARALDAPALTGTGVIIGTPDYMSPEQVSSHKDVGCEADIYALGVLTYRMLTGSRPFQGSTTEILLAHLEKMPPAASSINPMLSPAIDAVFNKVLAKIPQDRYATAGAFVTALREAIGAPTAVGAVTPPVGSLKHPNAKHVIPQAAMSPTPPVSAAPALSSEEVSALRAQAARRRKTPLWPFWAGFVVLMLFVAALASQAVFGARDRGLVLQTSESATRETRLATDTANMTVQSIRFGSTPSPTNSAAAEQTNTPEQTVEPTSRSEPSATALAGAAVASPRPVNATNRPVVAPTNVVAPTTAPVPTAVSATNTSVPLPPTATPCASPLQGGFGLLWRNSPDIANNLGCPSIGEQAGQASVQYFSGGMMYYWQPTGTIYVLYGAGTGSWQSFPDPGGSDQPQESPPAGLYEPVRGFGTIWRTNPGVRDVLGWASTPESPMTGVYQPFPNGLMVYSPVVAGTSARIWVLNFNGVWSQYADLNS